MGSSLALTTTRGVVCLGMLLGSLSAACGQNFSLTLSGPAGPVSAGTTVTFRFNILNTSSDHLFWDFPAHVQCRLVWRQRTVEAEAKLQEATRETRVNIAPGTFERREYGIVLPEGWIGEVTVKFPSLPATPLVLDVQEKSAEPDTVSEETGLISWLKGRKRAEGSDTYDPDDFFKKHVFGYEPLYFIAGTRSPNAKFQISFKYRLLNDRGRLAQGAPWLTGLHVAYTQTSFWDWNGPSAPFFDTSYKPEFLYLWQRLAGGEPEDWFRLDVQGGFQHESNGKGGADSRSLNIAYLRPAFVFGRETGLQLTLKPRAWIYVGDLSDNPDIKDYRGYVDLRAVLGWKRGLEISALGRLGDDRDRGSIQIDATYPLMVPPAGSLSLYLQAQYFTGYGESLLGYNEKTDVFRVGISLYR